jgi:hypothetical protein
MIRRGVLGNKQENAKGNTYLLSRLALAVTSGAVGRTCHEPITMLPRTDAGETSAEYIGITGWARN